MSNPWPSDVLAREVLYEGYKAAGTRFMAHHLGRCCLAEIKGEEGRVKHNDVIQQIKVIIAPDLLPQMYADMSDTILHYAEMSDVMLANQKKGQQEGLR